MSANKLSELSKSYKKDAQFLFIDKKGKTALSNPGLVNFDARVILRKNNQLEASSKSTIHTNKYMMDSVKQLKTKFDKKKVVKQ